MSRKFTGVALLALLASSSGLINSARAGSLPSDWEDKIQMAVRAYDKGENRVAFDAFYKLMADGVRRFGEGDGRMVRLYANMGAVYDEEKQYSYAEDVLKKGLSIAQKGYGAESVETVPSLINLGEVYVHLNKDSQAKPLFDKALAIVGKQGDAALPYAAVIETNLGAMYFAQGNYAFGEAHFKKASEIAAKAFGPTHLWSTTIGGMYAACMRAGGKVKEAKVIERAAVAKANENNSPFAVWNRRYDAAEDAMTSKQYDSAEGALKGALQIAQRIDSEPMLQALTLNKYGDLLLAQDKPALAADKYKAAQVIADSVLGPEDKSVLVHAKQLAELEKAQNQYHESEPLYQRLVVYAKKTNGPDSDEYAAALKDLADVYSAWAQYPNAATYYAKLLALQERRYGPDSEKLIPTLVLLGGASQNNTTYFTEVNAKAETQLKRAADLAAKHYGKTSKEVTEVWDALSRYYQRHFDWEKATKACTQVISASEKNYGPEAPETVKALEHYAVVLRAAGLRNEAEPVEARIAKLKGTTTTRDD